MFKGYMSRWHFILNHCQDRNVLHLGCIGITEGSLAEKVEAMRGGDVLHTHLRRVARELAGIDYDRQAVQELNRLGFAEILYGNVEQLEDFGVQQTFDVILCGDLIEHLSQPGRMLNGLRPLMDEDTKLLITTPNAFGIFPFLRYARGGFREGTEHVLSFSIFTLHNLLQRHGFSIEEAYTCYNRPPQGWTSRVRYAVGIPFLKLFPQFGGTLLVVAKLGRQEFAPHEEKARAVQWSDRY